MRNNALDFKIQTFTSHTSVWWCSSEVGTPIASNDAATYYAAMQEMI